MSGRLLMEGKGVFCVPSAFRNRPRGLMAASKPKRATVRGARADYGGSGGACQGAKVLSRHARYNRKRSTSYIAADASELRLQAASCGLWERRKKAANPQCLSRSLVPGNAIAFGSPLNAPSKLGG